MFKSTKQAIKMKILVFDNDSGQACSYYLVEEANKVTEELCLIIYRLAKCLPLTKAQKSIIKLIIRREEI